MLILPFRRHPTTGPLRGDALSMNESPFEDESYHEDNGPTRWQENHGYLLLAFLAFVLLIGAGIMTYRQYRFIPPRFPSPDAIPDPVPVPQPPDMVPPIQ